MTALATKLESRLHEWNPATAAAVEKLVGEIIELADAEVLDLARTRQVEQEVLDLIDES